MQPTAGENLTAFGHTEHEIHNFRKDFEPRKTIFDVRLTHITFNLHY